MPDGVACRDPGFVFAFHDERGLHLYGAVQLGPGCGPAGDRAGKARGVWRVRSRLPRLSIAMAVENAPRLVPDRGGEVER